VSLPDQTSEIGLLYRNSNLLPIQESDVNFLPALHGVFLTRGTKRLLLVIKDGSVVSELVSGNSCWTLAGNQRKKSRTPRKRKVPDPTNDENVQTYSDNDSWEDFFANCTPPYRCMCVPSSSNCRSSSTAPNKTSRYQSGYRTIPLCERAIQDEKLATTAADRRS
jgi:hypothetical protein